MAQVVLYHDVRQHRDSSIAVGANPGRRRQLFRNAFRRRRVQCVRCLLQPLLLRMERAFLANS